MVVVDAAHGDFAAAADELFTGGAADLQTFFDHTALEVKAGGGGLKEEEEEEEEELEWLSNKDAFPAVETMAPAGGARPRKNGVRRRRCLHCGAERTPQWREGPEGPGTLCNACGVRYRAVGRLAPEYRPLSSPTFCPELHSNRHRRVLEMRRPREEGESAKEKAFSGEQELVLEMMAFSGTRARPRTRGLRRPRQVVWWSPSPPRPSAPAIHLWRSTTAQRLAASAAAPIAGGAPRDEVGLGVSAGELVKRPPLDRAVGKRRCGAKGTPPAPAPAASGGQRLCWNCGAEQTSPAPATGQQRCWNIGKEETTPRTSATKPRGAKMTPNDPATEPEQRMREPRETKNTPRAPATKPAGKLLLSKPKETKNTPRAPALLCELGKTPRAPATKPSAGQCQHCGTEETPQWRHGPDGRRTLCNACGMQFRAAGRLVPEYRPLSSPTFSPELHSNIRRNVAEMCRRREDLARAFPAAAAGDK
ncbi:hypothetical protein PR202_gb08202 [Eleusine coracana subsp. coracana]|uniref:GATA-type domain-containing protein n=1 Tax=Eleusine coracana subsp. coracana TaxID=191504 RepID=A0AAV5EEJ2_ELECO|nr:hypothetical protein PR202_gb08202 [Eleusine coracana subsp. coracana]